MDNFTKLCLFVIAVSTSILASQSFFRQTYTHIIKSEEVQRVTLCSASGDCGFGTHYNAPLILDGRQKEGLYLVPDSFRY